MNPFVCTSQCDSSHVGGIFLYGSRLPNNMEILYWDMDEPVLWGIPGLGLWGERG